MPTVCWLILFLIFLDRADAVPAAEGQRAQQRKRVKQRSRREDPTIVPLTMVAMKVQKRRKPSSLLSNRPSCTFIAQVPPSQVSETLVAIPTLVTVPK
jgi:hypothetical protein